MITIKLSNICLSAPTRYEIPSNQLYCALVNAGIQENIETNKLREIAISNGLPWKKDVLYAPINTNLKALILNYKIKNFNEIRKKIKGMPIPLTYFDEINQEKITKNIDELKTEKQKILPLFEETKTAVNENETAKEGTLFREQFWKTDEEAGIYFKIIGLNENEITKCMNYLKKDGLLGNKTRGKGIFEYQITEEKQGKGNHFISLSNYSPTNEELTYFQEHDELVSYSLMENSGWTESSQPKQKPSITQLRAGAILPTPKREAPYGKNGEYSIEGKNHEVFWQGKTIPYYMEVN